MLIGSNSPASLGSLSIRCEYAANELPAISRISPFETADAIRLVDAGDAKTEALRSIYRIVPFEADAFAITVPRRESTSVAEINERVSSFKMRVPASCG